jgi:hypothetical protein
VLISVKLRGKNEEDIPNKSRSLFPSAYSVPPCFKGFDFGFARFVFIRVDSRLTFICVDPAEICGEAVPWSPWRPSHPLR